jgi:hypothetical protein
MRPLAPDPTYSVEGRGLDWAKATFIQGKNAAFGIGHGTAGVFQWKNAARRWGFSSGKTRPNK